MPLFRIRRLAASPEQVYAAALDTAAQAGFEVSLADPGAGQLFLSKTGSLRRSPHRFIVTVTDSGIGGTVLHVSWEPHPSLLPRRSDAAAAARLCRAVERRLATT